MTFRRTKYFGSCVKKSSSLMYAFFMHQSGNWCTSQWCKLGRDWNWNEKKPEHCEHQVPLHLKTLFSQWTYVKTNFPLLDKPTHFGTHSFDLLILWHLQCKKTLLLPSIFKKRKRWKHTNEMHKFFFKMIKLTSIALSAKTFLLSSFTCFFFLRTILGNVYNVCKLWSKR